jgi:hypothetical protein
MTTSSTVVKPKLRYEQATSQPTQPRFSISSPHSRHAPCSQDSPASEATPSLEVNLSGTGIEMEPAPLSSLPRTLSDSAPTVGSTQRAASSPLSPPSSAHLVCGGCEFSDVFSEDAVTVAWWNGGRMSSRSAQSFERKLLILERMVADTPSLSVILLQELFSHSAAGIARHLRGSTGDAGWTAVGCGSDLSQRRVSHAHRHSYGMSCQAAVLNSSTVDCLAHAYAESGGAGEMGGFLRSPLVLVLQRKTPPGGRPSRLLCVANLHVSYREPRCELQLLPVLLDAMREGCVLAVRRRGARGLRRDDVTYALCGDFNRGAQSADFAALRERKFVELIRPPRGRTSRVSDELGETACEGLEGLRFLTSPTTAGGKFYDNLWMDKDARRHVLLDAHVYGVWTRGRRLAETGPASVGRLRGEMSDHSPVVASLMLAPISEDDACCTDAPWAASTAFAVALRR